MGWHASGKLPQHPFLMAEAHSKIGRIRGQGVSTEVHPGVAEQPIAARIVNLNAPMPLLRWPCQSSDPRLRLAWKPWIREPPAGLHWRQDWVAFVAWKPCRETAILKEKKYYAKLLSNSYARLPGVDRSTDCLPCSAVWRSTHGSFSRGRERSTYPSHPLLTKSRHVTHNHVNFACLRVDRAVPRAQSGTLFARETGRPVKSRVRGFSQ